MKKFLYGAIYFFILAVIFKGFLVKVAESMGIDLPISETVLISNDGGYNWQKPKVPEKTISGENLFFNNQNPSEIFLASNNGIFKIKNEKTTNRNDKIKKTLNSVNISGFIQDPKSPNIFYLVSNGIEKSELFVSYNYGESFRSLFVTKNDNKISVFKINPINSNYLYIGTQGGLFLVSQDKGNSWEKKKSFSPRPIKNIEINQLTGDIYISLSSKIVNLFPPEDVKRLEPTVYLSIDGGNSFSKINKFNGTPINKIEIDNLCGDVYFVSSYNVFFLRKNKISSLNLISQTEKDKITAFTIDPKNPNILYVGVKDILYKTTDKGKSWNTINVPISGKKIKNIKINQENSNVILLSFSN